MKFRSSFGIIGSLPCRQTVSVFDGRTLTDRPLLRLREIIESQKLSEIRMSLDPWAVEDAFELNSLFRVPAQQLISVDR